MVWIRRSRKLEDIILYTTRSLDYFNNIGAGIGINLLYNNLFPAASLLNKEASKRADMSLQAYFPKRCFGGSR